VVFKNQYVRKKSAKLVPKQGKAPIVKRSRKTKKSTRYGGAAKNQPPYKGFLLTVMFQKVMFCICRRQWAEMG